VNILINNNQDLSVNKTEFLLANALLNLLKSNVFSNITVNDICIEAMVSRSCFYTHFEDKYALLRFCLNMSNNERIDILTGKSINEYTQILLEQIKSNISVYKNIILSGQKGELMEIILSPHIVNIKNAVINNLDDPHLNSIPVEITSFYHASAFVNSILYWIEHNMPYSIEDMSAYLTALLPPSIQDISLPFETA